MVFFVLYEGRDIYFLEYNELDLEPGRRPQESSPARCWRVRGTKKTSPIRCRRVRRARQQDAGECRIFKTLRIWNTLNSFSFVRWIIQA